MIYVLNVFDLVEAKVKAGEVREGVQTFDVRDQVVVEVEVFQCRGKGRREMDGGDVVLAEAKFLETVIVSLE